MSDKEDRNPKRQRERDPKREQQSPDQISIRVEISHSDRSHFSASRLRADVERSGVCPRVAHHREASLLHELLHDGVPGEGDDLIARTRNEVNHTVRLEVGDCEG